MRSVWEEFILKRSLQSFFHLVVKDYQSSVSYYSYILSMSDSKKLAQLLKKFSMLDKLTLIKSIQWQSSELFVFSSRLISCFVSSRKSLFRSSDKTFLLSIKILFEELSSSVTQFESLMLNASTTKTMMNMYQWSDSNFRLCEEFLRQKDQSMNHWLKKFELKMIRYVLND